MRQNIFSEVKQYVTARSAAEFYGIHVNRRGMARCRSMMIIRQACCWIRTSIVSAARRKAM